jgi:integration host factor subunit alpha
MIGAKTMGAEHMRSGALTRADLAEAVHQEVGLSRQDCADLVERTLELIVGALERGEIVKLSGFGVFQVRDKRARMGRNPKTGEPAAIDPRRVISFRASQVMKAKVENAHLNLAGMKLLDGEG